MPAAPAARRTPASGGMAGKAFGARGEIEGARADFAAEAGLIRAVFRAGDFARRFRTAARLAAIRPLPAFAFRAPLAPFRRLAIRPVSLELTRGKPVLISRPARPAQNPWTGVFTASPGGNASPASARPYVAS